MGPSVAVAALPAAAVAKAVAAASPTGAIPVPACPDNAVPIKGNVSSSGEKIYHKSGGRYYDSVKIDQDGERYFCNEADAEKAGWRASKQ